MRTRFLFMYILLIIKFDFVFSGNVSFMILKGYDNLPYKSNLFITISSNNQNIFSTAQLRTIFLNNDFVVQWGQESNVIGNLNILNHAIFSRMVIDYAHKPNQQGNNPYQNINNHVNHINQRVLQLINNNNNNNNLGAIGSYRQALADEFNAM